MSRRKGFIAVSLLPLLSVLTAVLGGLLFSLLRGRGGSLAYRNGLSAIYAAESGANWALASLKQGPVENKERTIPFGVLSADVAAKIIVNLLDEKLGINAEE